MGRPAVAAGVARVVAPGASWDAVVGRLASAGQNDVYFDHRYVVLYAPSPARAEAFVFEADGATFFLPFVRRAIDPALGGAGRFDFESAYGYGGPLSDSTEPEFLAAAWQAFQAHCLATGLVVGFLRFHPLLENHRVALSPRLDVRRERATVYLSLDRARDAVWAAYAEDNREKIRKARAAGVEVTPETGVNALRAFGALYRERMEELSAAADYRFDDEYFAGLARLGPETVRVYFARRRGELLGGAIVLLSDRFAHYHLSASPRRHFRWAPNNILRHEVITSLLGGRQERLHFGGGVTGAPDDTLLAFKRKFSNETGEFHIGAYVADEETYAAVRAAWAPRHPDAAARYAARVLAHRMA
jgi:hypothetical protein